MTDKSATERLREMLDERGVSKVNVESIDGSYWGVRWFEGAANAEWRENDEHAELLVINATPEQAIAATLADDGYERMRDERDELVKQRNRAESDAKTQRNNYEQVSSARLRWQKKAQKAEAERDEYREKLGKALDLAHEIGELMP